MREGTTRCRQCLLRELAEESDRYKAVTLCLEKIPDKERTPEELYESRLRTCKVCRSLDNGTCRQCGCYVELRAARKAVHCPKKNPEW